MRAAGAGRKATGTGAFFEVLANAELLDQLAELLFGGVAHAFEFKVLGEVLVFQGEKAMVAA